MKVSKDYRRQDVNEAVERFILKLGYELREQSDIGEQKKHNWTANLLKHGGSSKLTLIGEAAQRSMVTTEELQR